MKKILTLISLFIITVATTYKVNALEPTMSSDVSSYPGAGSVPEDSIASYINTGYRIYLVDRKTGGLVPGSVTVDMASQRSNVSSISFFKTSSKYRKIAFNNSAVANKGVYTTFLPKSQLVKYSSDDTIYIPSYEKEAFPTNWNTTGGKDPVNVFNNALRFNYPNTPTDEVSPFYDFIFDYIYPVCEKTNYNCRYEKMKEIGAYELIDKTKGDVPENRKSNFYVIWEPLIFYKIFDGGYYALTAVESAMIFNETNFPKWWSGVTVRTAEMYHEFAPAEFNNILNHKSCTTDLNEALYAFRNGVDGAYTMYTNWKSRCERTMKWLLDYQVNARNPRFTVHTKSYTIGKVTYANYKPDGTETNKYPSKFDALKIVGNKYGIGMGVVETTYTDTKCPAELSTVQGLATNGCCVKVKEYIDNLSAHPDLAKNEAEVRRLYDTNCNTCSMANATKISSTIGGMPSNQCCLDKGVTDWFDNTNNKLYNPAYPVYETAYNKACKVPPPPGGDPEVCKYQINTQYPDTCYTNKTGFISDISDWNCIFKSQSLGGTDFSNHYDEFSNRYCNIFCRQDVNYEFPSASFTILAGNHFTVGTSQSGSTNWNPITMSSTATCKADAAGINHTKFTEDWRVSNIAVQTAWNNLQIEIAKEKSVAAAKVKEVNSSSCSCKYNTAHNSCCKSEVRVCNGEMLNGQCVTTSSPSYGTRACPAGKMNFSTGKCNACPSGYSPDGSSCKSNTPSCSSGSLVNGQCVAAASYSYNCAPGAEDNTKYDLYEPTSVTYNRTAYKEGNFCSNSRPTYNVSSYRNTYNQAINTRDGYLTTLNQCTNYSYNQTFNPPLSVEYEEAKYGGKFNLIGTPNDSKTTVLENGSDKTIMSYSCTTEGSVCSSSSVTYPAFNNLTHTSIRTVNYKLDGTVYQYVDKLTGNSAHTPGGFPQYVVMGYNNLPVDFARYNGSYDIDINFSDLGTGNKFNPFITTGKANTDRCDGSPNCKYTCEYGVENKVLCNSLTEDCTESGGGGNGGVIGLNVLFRPISLSNPFPGVDGTGRVSGTNWFGSTTKISNNRGVKAEEIYSKREPMYQITLDSKTIRAIRDDNQRNSYTDFKLTCKAGTGKECVSDFITTLRKTYGMKIDKCARDAGDNWANTCTFQ